MGNNLYISILPFAPICSSGVRITFGYGLMGVFTWSQPHM